MSPRNDQQSLNPAVIIPQYPGMGNKTTQLGWKMKILLLG
jgi:hypothetical protein